MIDGAVGHRPAEHRFEAQGLAGKLQIVVQPLLARAVLVFHRIDGAVRPELDHIALADQPQPVGPDRQCILHPCARLLGLVGVAIDSDMLGVATRSMDVVRELALDMDQPATPGTVGVVVEGREGDGFCVSHVHAATMRL